MARKSVECTRNHAYGLEVQHCVSCGAHIASRCPECGYMSLYDDEHRPDCAASFVTDKEASESKRLLGSVK